MATLFSPSFPTYIKFLTLYSSLLLLVVLAHKTHANKQDFHTIHSSSFFQDATVCKPSTGSRKGPSTMKLFHRYGPCFPMSTAIPSLSEILSRDQSRVRSIQALLTHDSNAKKGTGDMKADLPAQSGISFNTGNYIVSIGVGTPAKTLSLAFDTGSSLTWTQCEPCAGSCYKQKETIFNPSSSTSYSNVSCSSSECSLLLSATGVSPSCDGTTCVYGTKYGDGSISVGWLSKDALTLTPSDVFQSFLFGCAQESSGLFGTEAGILGLGRDPLSLISQTSQKYQNYFSYCIPSTPSSTGHLTLGKSGASTGSVAFTPLSSGKGQLYFIDIVGISVGGRQLSIDPAVFKSAGNIIDSGTVITRLPPTAYKALSQAFQQGMAQYPRAPPSLVLDTCYDLSNFTTLVIPKIGLTFSGNVMIDLDLFGILSVHSRKQVCLAFAGNADDNDVGIFGNTQQKTFEVVYDVAGGKIGFGAGGCN